MSRPTRNVDASPSADAADGDEVGGDEISGDEVGGNDLDLAVIVGTLSSDPVAHDLPSGSRLVRYEVTVRDRSPADSVPVSWFDPSRPPALAAGDRVIVVGRVRRRFFRAAGATRSATEVVARSICRPRSTATAAAALADAAAVLDRLSTGDRR